MHQRLSKEQPQQRQQVQAEQEEKKGTSLIPPPLRLSAEPDPLRPESSEEENAEKNNIEPFRLENHAYIEEQSENPKEEIPPFRLKESYSTEREPAKKIAPFNFKKYAQKQLSPKEKIPPFRLEDYGYNTEQPVAEEKIPPFRLKESYSTEREPAKKIAPFNFQKYAKKQLVPEEEKTELEAEPTEKIQVDQAGDGNADAPPSSPSDNAPQAPATPNGSVEGSAEANLTANVDTSSSQSYISSLATNAPSGFIKGVSEAGNTVPSIQEKEKAALKTSLPSIEQPTGIPTKKAQAKKQAETVEAKTATEPIVLEELEQPKTPETHIVPLGKRPQVATPQPIANTSTEGGNDPAFEQNMRTAVSQLPVSDPTLKTAAGTRPKVQLTGAADPKQNATNSSIAKADVEKGVSDANAKTKQDFGENELYPDIETEQLSFDGELSAPPPAAGEGLGELPQVPTTILTGFDTNAKAKMDEQVAVETAKNDEQYAKKEADSQTERETKMAELDTETLRVEQEQISAQNTGKDEVSKQREAWQQEHETLKENYASESSTERARIDQEISTKVTETNTGVEQKLSEAENQATQEKQKAEGKAQAEKSKANKKKGGFWSRVGSALSSAFDALKSTVNAIFDGLRALVKTIIETAKKAVNAMIEVARKAITGLIKTFGTFLKGLVSTLLAAFPGIAKRINALIDKAVDTAIAAVNKLAEGLKAFANMLLDALGKALDGILALYQQFYNLMLDALKFIAEGILKILIGLANLAKSATQSPSEFMGQLSTELLGQDVTQPLPNERPLPGNAATIAQSTVAPTSLVQEAQTLDKKSYTPNDFDVPVASDLQLSEGMMSQLAVMGDGEFEFGQQSDDQHSMDALKEDVASPEMQAAEPEMQSAPTQAAPSLTGVVADGLVGPFHSAGERASHLAGQMTGAVSKWWNENKVTIIAVVVAGIAGLIAANLITGGAVMAALPLLMQVVGAYFAGEAVFQMAKHFGGFLTQAWPGNLAQGAQSLARGFAVGAIELVFALLFGGKAAIKGVKSVAQTARKSGVKGVAKMGKNAAKGAVKNGVQTTKNLGTIAKQGAKNTVKNGKFAMQGIRKGALKGAKSIDEMGQFLGKKFRFKKFRIRIKNRRFKLEGEINPWVLLADGDLKHIDRKTLGKGKVGDEVMVNGQKGFVVGAHNTKAASKAADLAKETDELGVSRYIKKLIERGDDIDRLGDFKELLKAQKAGNTKKIIDGSTQIDYKAIAKKYGDEVADAMKQRGSLAKNLPNKPKGVDWEAHHIIPVGLLTESPALLKALEGGFKFNSKSNGKWLRRYSNTKRVNKYGETIASKAGVHASHPKYTEEVQRRLAFLDELSESMSAEDLAQQINKIAEDMSSEMDNMLRAKQIDPDVRLNNYFAPKD